MTHATIEGYGQAVMLGEKEKPKQWNVPIGVDQCSILLDRIISLRHIQCLVISLCFAVGHSHRTSSTHRLNPSHFSAVGQLPVGRGFHRLNL